MIFKQRHLKHLKRYREIAAILARHGLGWLEEFAFILRNELDYTCEGHNADRICRNFAGDKRLHVPQIYWDYTSARVITMEDISGIKITDIKSLETRGWTGGTLPKTAHILPSQ